MQKILKMKKQIGVIFIVVISFFIGVNIGYTHRPAIEKITTVTNKETAVNTNADFSTFWKVWEKIMRNILKLRK